MSKLTRYRREVLMRLADGPKTIDEARDGHPNIMPTLIRFGWAQALELGDPRNYHTHKTLFEITPAGRTALKDRAGSLDTEG